MEVWKKLRVHRCRRRDGALSKIQHLDGLEDIWDLSEAGKKKRWEARAIVAKDNIKVGMDWRQ